MKMKIVALLLAIVLFAVTLTSCGVETAGAYNKTPFDDRFVRYDTNHGMTVLVDKGTGVCYLWRGAGYKGGLTVMLDEDGRPLTYWEDGYEY